MAFLDIMRSMQPDIFLEYFHTFIDLIKTIIPYGVLLFIFAQIKDDLKLLIRTGHLKVTAPGLSLETYQNQNEVPSKNEKNALDSLNAELKTTKQINEKLVELQDATTKNKNDLFLLYHFERTYRVLFPSQMVILSIIYTHNEVTNALAEALHRRTIWATQYNMTYEQFMAFPFQSGLITLDSSTGKIALTPIGKMFWEYLKQENVSLKMPASDIIINS